VSVKLVTPASGLVVSLEDAKKHLRVDFNDDDELITALIKAATRSAEKFLGRSLLDQTFDFFMDAFPSEKTWFELPVPPLIEVQKISYKDSSGDYVDMDQSSYEVDDASQPARISLVSNGSWPSPLSVLNAVRVTFRAGYLTQDSPAQADVPADIIAAIKLQIGHLYENRESVVISTPVFALPQGSEFLLRPHRAELSLA
jgi:uncharacterized phiE125 gp8 family phage protein